MSVWIYSDADNTLWDTDALFAEAQLALLSAAEHLVGVATPTVERLSFVRRFDQAIASRHHSRLRYPPALLMRALSRGLIGTLPDLAAEQVIAEGSRVTVAEADALTLYCKILSGAPVLLGGVREGLFFAQENRAPVHVITEGPLEVVQSRLRALEIDGYISGALSATKSPDLYRRLQRRAGARQAVMIGDQPDRDIRFAHQGGLKTILIRGRFQPGWIDPADVALADNVAADFLGAVRFAVKGAQMTSI